MKTTKRFEFKYVISYLDYFNIKNTIENLMNHDKHGDDINYLVNSIYLDDIVFTGASDKAFGNQIHQKYRVRYYNDFNQRKLELKYKIGDESTKYSTLINDEVYKAIIEQNIDVLEEYIEDDLIRRFVVDMMTKNLEPKVSILYKREAYKDDTDNLRITFDHTLLGGWFDEGFDPDNQLISGNKLIMEIKYEYYVPNYIKEIIKRVKPNQIAFSKYFLGFSSLGL